LWLKRIQQSEFNSALVICGLVHLLSFAFRIRDAKFSVQAINYANWQRPRRTSEATMRIFDWDD
jgi:hypothetical protein